MPISLGLLGQIKTASNSQVGGLWTINEQFNQYKNNTWPRATFSITPASNSLTEGSQITITINTTNVNDGTTLYWTNGGTTSSADFSGGVMNGSFTITNNTGSVVTPYLFIDALVEPTETLIFQVRLNSITGPIVASLTINVLNQGGGGGGGGF